ncbi:MAG: hypothetical protein ACOYN3_08310 [Acidimicrobiia bacterium]
MQQATLTDLQLRTGYPCVTILVNTAPGQMLTPIERSRIEQFIRSADRRLTGDVSDAERSALVARCEALLDECSTRENSTALALCVSSTFSAGVRLQRPVIERVVIDATFATRDILADSHWRSAFRVVTVSERMVRLLVGDEDHVVEQLDNSWPLMRSEEESSSSWMRAIAQALLAECRANPIPTVVAGVDRSVMRTVAAAGITPVGVIPGNHDRSSWDALFHAAFPLVRSWLEVQQMRALDVLDTARSHRRFAAGLDESWVLGAQGRIAHLVVEDGFHCAGRIVDERVVRATDIEAPDVIDDVVDELIETVVRFGGSVTIVGDGALAEHDRIAAALRF